MKHILLLGPETSLGKAFSKWALGAMHNITPFDPDSYNSTTESSFKLGRMLRDGMRFDWVVNCYGRNQLDKIGSTPYQREGEEAHGAGFTNSLLIDNVMPIYWVVDGLVRNRHPGARVLNVASQTYRIAQTNTAIYCASKAALVQLSRTMARELAEKGWVINCLAPGKIVDTAMARITDAQVLALRGWSEEEADGYARRGVPMRRFTNTTEVVEAMYKILDLPAYINGTCIDMTGGA